jgi:hypothetical protein
VILQLGLELFIAEELRERASYLGFQILGSLIIAFN